MVIITLERTSDMIVYLSLVFSSVLESDMTINFLVSVPVTIKDSATLLVIELTLTSSNTLR